MMDGIHTCAHIKIPSEIKKGMVLKDGSGVLYLCEKCVVEVISRRWSAIKEQVEKENSSDE